MAYKFQLGAFTASGSITAEGELNGTDISGSGNISGSTIALSDASGLAGGSLENNNGVLKVSNGGIDTDQLAADAVDGTKLADDAVASEHIADAAVLSASIAAAAVTTGHLAAGAVTTAKLAADAVDGTKLADDAVASEHIADAAVLSASIAAGAVATGHLADDAVTAAKLAANAVVSGSIVDGNVTTAKLAADAVDGTKLADDAVASEHIADAAVLSASIAAGAVTNDHLVNNSVTVSGKNVALGGTVNLDSLTAGDGLSGSVSTYNGSAANTFEIQLSGTSLTVDGDGLRLSPTIPDSHTFSSDVTIAGNLTVQGNQTIVDTEILRVKDSNIEIGSGSAPGDGMGITFGTSGTPETLEIGASGSQLQSSLPLSASEFYGDGSFLTNITPQESIQTITGSSTIALNSGVQIIASGSSMTLTLPLASTAVGKMIKVKARVGAGQVTLQRSGADLIDGVAEVVLESENAAISLIASGSEYFII